MKSLILSFSCQSQEKYYPTWMEVSLSFGVITLIILFYRFIVRRMAILE
jgi:Ni/Fe-hydrogenase subunit HybB-like protein